MFLRTSLIKETFFWNWHKNFNDVVNVYVEKDQNQKYQTYFSTTLGKKEYQNLFFYKAEAENFPFFGFWSGWWDLPNINPSKSLEIFEKNREKSLDSHLKRALAFWRFFPQMLRDYWLYFPRYNISFNHVECAYLDFWFQLPKVFDSLLGVILAEGFQIEDPLVKLVDRLYREHILFRELLSLPALSKREYASDQKRRLLFLSKRGSPGDFLLLPPIPEEDFSEEIFKRRILEFFYGEDKERVFLKVIHFYLDSRLILKDQCTVEMESKGLLVTSDSLVEYFLSDYIFKGVSDIVKRFLLANSKERDSFKEYRKYQFQEWRWASSEGRRSLIEERKTRLEEENRRKVVSSKAKRSRAAYRAYLRRRESEI